MQLASRFHAGATDKAGRPYLDHVVRVAAAVDSHEEKLAALMHDLLEDTILTVGDLRCAGCPSRVVMAIDALTRRPEETYSDFVVRAGRDRIARSVKLADLMDNSNEDRLQLLEPALAQRLREKYAAALKLLRETQPHDDADLQARSDEERGVPLGASELGTPIGSEICSVTFWCGAEDCGRPTETVTLVQGSDSVFQPNGKYSLSVVTFLGNMMLGVSEEKEGQVQALIQSGDPLSLRRYDLELAATWCRRCGRSYCGDHIRTMPKFDEGFFDCYEGTCPEGHRWTMWD
jgi:hypothetical protein